MPHLLVIDDIDDYHRMVADTLGTIYTFDFVSVYEDAVKKIYERNYEAIIMNWKFHNIGNGRTLLYLLKVKFPEVPIVVISASYEGAVLLLRQRFPNVHEVIMKPRESKRKSSGRNGRVLTPFEEDLLHVMSEIHRQLLSVEKLPLSSLHRERLINELAKHGPWREGDASNRRSMLSLAGLPEALTRGIRLDGTSDIAASNLIFDLEHRGISSSKPTHYVLGELVEYLLRNAFDMEGQFFLMLVLVRYRLIKDQAHLRDLQQQFTLPNLEDLE